MDSNNRQVSLEEAFARVPRSLFLPESERRFAGSNVPLAIGHEQTNSQPSTVADMLALLDPQTGDRVLDLGSGSGWTTALLGVLVGRQGHVTGVERHRQLIDHARTSLRRIDEGSGAQRMHEHGRIDFIPATPGVLGLPTSSPFDRILVSAEAAVLPAELVAQLTIGGIMVIPVGGEMLRAGRTGDGDSDVAITTHGLYRFVPLIRD